MSFDCSMFMRAVTVCPKWCELFFIIYRTLYSATLKVYAVTVCLFRIFTFESSLLSLF